jgi:ADP-ribose pyrophosphatase
MVPWDGYTPVEYEAPHIMRGGAAWIDPPDPSSIEFNTTQPTVDRKSFTGTYVVGINGKPKNPMGRTGMTGRGLLGRWGPNHAADPVVTRMVNGVLQFVGINRTDGGGWALPGGMVEPGDTVSATLRKEFGEEAMSSLTLPPAERAEVEQSLATMFASGVELFRGYVDDPRNTDHAWLETVAVHYHLPDRVAAALTLRAGDDAAAVRWIDISPGLQLYASHRDFVRLAAARHGITI